jgi:CO/xanthine dehydrogenase FAD-binding subunit
VIIRADEAEKFAAGLFDESGWDTPFQPAEAALKRCGELAAAAARPIDDQRGTIAYRRHVIAVMTARALRRAAGAA